jgi:hypothetical protein
MQKNFQRLDMQKNFQRLDMQNFQRLEIQIFPTVGNFQKNFNFRSDRLSTLKSPMIFAFYVEYFERIKICSPSTICKKIFYDLLQNSSWAKSLYAILRFASKLKLSKVAIRHFMISIKTQVETGVPHIS